MSNMVLNYDKAVYENKISELESYVKRLDAHRVNMENYRNRLKELWDDSESEKYYSILSEQIQAVKNSGERITDLKMLYENASGDITEAKAAMSGLMDDAEAAMKVLNIAKG